MCVVTDGSYLYAIGGIDKTGQYLNIVERFDRERTHGKIFLLCLQEEPMLGVQ